MLRYKHNKEWLFMIKNFLNLIIIDVLLTDYSTDLVWFKKRLVHFYYLDLPWYFSIFVISPSDFNVFYSINSRFSKII